MMCLFETTGRQGIYRCSRCRYMMRHPSPHPPERVYRDCGGKPGLGDAVAWAVKTLTIGFIKPCGGCRRRQNKLNEALNAAQAWLVRR